MNVNTKIKVSRANSLKNTGFRKAFEALPYREMIPIREEMMRSLGWSLSSFYIKKRGDTPIYENEVPIIEEIFRRHGLNAFTGEKIN